MDVAPLIEVLDHSVRYIVPGNGCARGCYIQDCLHGLVPVLCHHIQGNAG